MSITGNVRKGTRLLAGAIGVALVCAAPAVAAPADVTKATAKAAANPLGCTVDHDLSNPFRAWNDTADYALAPVGDFEGDTSAWTLSRSASVVEGNQPFDIGTAGHSSLRLPSGSSAISAPMCIDSTYPHFRLFARNTGNAKGALRAEVLYLTAKGDVKASASRTVVAKDAGWFPSDSLTIGITFDTAVADGAAPVAFRFTAAGKEADWQIDDVYVDPMMRR
jgi:hypothetical protein